MPIDTKNALKDILSYIKDTFPAHSEWFVGVSDNPFDNLHTYGVDEVKDAWIIRNMHTPKDAMDLFHNLTTSHKLTPTPHSKPFGTQVFVYRKRSN